MPQEKSKKILLYFFLFILIGTLNNKNLNNIDFVNVNNVNITGFDEYNKNLLIENLDFLKNNNIFFLNKIKISKTIDSNNLVEKYSIFKEYPATLNIKINKTSFIANLKKDHNNFLIGSNGRLIKAEDENYDIPFIFGNFEISEFLEFKKIIDKSNLNFYEIKNLFFFPSKRWDVEISSGIIIKLPKNNIDQALNWSLDILDNPNFDKSKIIDLRQYNQIVVNE